MERNGEELSHIKITNVEPIKLLLVFAAMF